MGPGPALLGDLPDALLERVALGRWQRQQAVELRTEIGDVAGVEARQVRAQRTTRAAEVRRALGWAPGRRRPRRGRPGSTRARPSACTRSSPCRRADSRARE